MEHSLNVTIQTLLAADVIFTANTDFLKIRRGETGYLALSAEPVGEFVGDIMFTAMNVPDGLTVSFPGGDTVFMDGINTMGVGVEIAVHETLVPNEYTLTFTVSGNPSQ